MVAEDAQWPDSIDVERAKKAEERARKRLADRESDMDVKRAEMALKRSIARIETTR